MSRVQVFFYASAAKLLWLREHPWAVMIILRLPIYTLRLNFLSRGDIGVLVLLEYRRYEANSRVTLLHDNVVLQIHTAIEGTNISQRHSRSLL